MLTCHNEREHQSSESKASENINNTNKIFLPEKRNNVDNPNVSRYENHAYVVTGPRSVAKTYYMFKMLEKKGNKRPVQIIIRSPKQYPNYETSNEIKQKSKYKGSVVIFDDMPGARNCSQKDDFFTRRRHCRYLLH